MARPKKTKTATSAQSPNAARSRAIPATRVAQQPAAYVRAAEEAAAEALAEPLDTEIPFSLVDHNISSHAWFIELKLDDQNSDVQSK
jgi:hypothetical protein